jgi:hypothetical protein
MPKLITAGNITTPFNAVLLTVKAFSLRGTAPDSPPSPATGHLRMSCDVSH